MVREMVMGESGLVLGDRGVLRGTEPLNLHPLFIQLMGAMHPFVSLPWSSVWNSRIPEFI
jgi:hypothetical protein